MFQLHIQMFPETETLAAGGYFIIIDGNEKWLLDREGPIAFSQACSFWLQISPFWSHYFGLRSETKDNEFALRLYLGDCM